MKLAKQVMMEETGAETWLELIKMYERKYNPAMTVQKAYRAK